MTPSSTGDHILNSGFGDASLIGYVLKPNASLSLGPDIKHLFWRKLGLAMSGAYCSSSRPLAIQSIGGVAAFVKMAGGNASGVVAGMANNFSLVEGALRAIQSHPMRVCAVKFPVDFSGDNSISPLVSLALPFPTAAYRQLESSAKVCANDSLGEIGHAASSSGYRSGRRSWRRTLGRPFLGSMVAFSMSMTRSAGTAPRFRQLEIT